MSTRGIIEVPLRDESPRLQKARQRGGTAMSPCRQRQAVSFRPPVHAQRQPVAHAEVPVHVSPARCSPSHRGVREDREPQEREGKVKEYNGAGGEL